MAEAPAAVLRDLQLLGQTSVLQLAIVLLDAATLDVMLHWFGVPIEAALAATLLSRVCWSFWLPMAPGLWLARHETREDGVRP